MPIFSPFLSSAVLCSCGRPSAGQGRSRNAQLVCVLADEGIQLSALALIRLVELQGDLATLPVTLHARVGDVALVRLLTLVNQF
jgi:hypothetical protein